MKRRRVARAVRFLPWALLAFGAVYLFARGAAAATKKIAASYVKHYGREKLGAVKEVLAQANRAQMEGDEFLARTHLVNLTRLYDPMGLLGPEIRLLLNAWGISRQLPPMGEAP